MIDFLAHDFWSGFWLVALCVAGFFTVAGQVKQERRILHVMITNWLAMRVLLTFFDYNLSMVLVADIMAFTALAAYVKTEAGKVCACLYFFIVQISILRYAGIIEPNEYGEWQDAIGFLILIIMAGAANDTLGKRKSRNHLRLRRMRFATAGIHSRAEPQDAAGVALAQDLGPENR